MNRREFLWASLAAVAVAVPACGSVAGMRSTRKRLDYQPRALYLTDEHGRTRDISDEPGGFVECLTDGEVIEVRPSGERDFRLCRVKNLHVRPDGIEAYVAEWVDEA